MPDANFSVNFTAELLASEACSVGDALVYDSSAGYWRVATAAVRAALGKRAEAVATSAYGGSLVGKVSYQQAGILPASVSGLGAGSAQWVRVSSAGRLERVATPGVSDDLVGRSESDGRVHLDLGVWDSANYAGGGGGGGGAPGGTVGQQQVNDGAGGFGATAHGAVGSVLRQTGATTSAFGQLDLADADAITGLLPLANVTPGSNTQVLTTTGGVATWATPAAGAAVTGSGFWRSVGGTLQSAAAAVDLAGGSTHITGALPVGNGGTGLTALGSSLQVLRTNVGVTAMEWATISAFTSPTGSGVMTTTSGAMNAASLAWGSANTVFTSNGSVGSWATIVNANVSASAAIAASKLAPPGSASQVIFNNGGSFGATSGFTYDGTGRITLATGANLGSGAVSTDGLVRSAYPGVSAVTLWGIKDNVGTDQTVIVAGAGNALAFGNTAMNLLISGVSAQFTFTSTWNASVASTGVLDVSGTKFGIGVPVGGYAAFSMPFRFKRAAITQNSTSDTTLSAAQYECIYLDVSGSPGGTFNLIGPNNEGATFNIKNGTSFTLTLKRSGGTGGTLNSSNAVWFGHNGTDYEKRCGIGAFP